MKSKNIFLTLKVAKDIMIDSLPLSKGEKIKALFVVSQTNYHGTYDVYVNKFKKLWGVNTLQLDKIFNALVDNGIIKLVQAGKYKELCRSYVMVTPFNVDTCECDVISFQYEAPGTPTFINRFIADGFTYQDNSKYQPRTAKRNKAVISQSVDYKALEARIAQLEEFIKANDLIIPAIPEIMESPQNSPEVPPVINAVHENTDSTPEIKPEDFVELMPGLKILHYDEGLIINWYEKLACIQNYKMMSGWADRMDLQSQIRLYTDIFKEQGSIINFRLDNRTKARLTKSNQPGIIAVDYEYVQAA